MSPRQRPIITASIVSHPIDAAAARELAAALSRAGVAIADWADPRRAAAGEVVQVVVLSAAALADPSWLAEVRPGSHVVVTRLEPVDKSNIRRPLTHEEQVRIDWLFDIHHASWRPGSELRPVLAGIAFDLSEHNMERQLADAVHAWAQSGYDEARLIEERALVATFRSVAGSFDARHWGYRWGLRLAAVHQFLALSLRRANYVLFRRVMWRIAAVLAIVLAGVTAANLAPWLAQQRLDNRAALATINDPDLQTWSPEWAAAQAAALLLHGTDSQRELARTTLREMLNEPWPVAIIHAYHDAGAFALHNGGRHAIVLYRDGPVSSVASVEIPTGHTLWSQALPDYYYDIAIDPSGAKALLAGANGLATIDLSSHQVQALRGRATESLRLAALVDQQTAVAVALDATIVNVDISREIVTKVATFASVADLRVLQDGAVLALAETTEGQIVMVDALTGDHRVVAPAEGFRATGGGISWDGRQVILPGVDGQYWTVAADEDPQPTGIAVPVQPQLVLWTEDDRLVVHSNERGAEVFFLPSAVALGRICRDVVRLTVITVLPGSDLIGCASDGLHSVWRLPYAPTNTDEDAGPGRASVTAAGITVTGRGREVVIQEHGVEFSFGGFRGQVSAVAVNAEGSGVIVGDSWGDVTIFQSSGDDWVLVTSWRVPGSLPIVAAGWAEGPVVTTIGGDTWRAPDCGACATDQGLLDTFRTRATACFTDRQLSYIDSATRNQLAINVCAPPLGRE